MNIEKIAISLIIALGVAGSAALASGGYERTRLQDDLPVHTAPADPADGLAGMHAPVPVEEPLAQLFGA